MSESSQTDTQNTPPAPAPETAATPSSPTPEEQLAAARVEAAAAHERHLRAVADLENYRRRALREKDELRQFAASGVMEDLIPIMDNLALGVAAARQPGQTDAKTIADGVSMVLEQFKSTLARHGLKEINPVGQPFDPNQHDCLSHLPDAKAPAETVTQVVRLGYSLNGRLLRPASVVVSSGAAAATDKETKS